MERISARTPRVAAGALAETLLATGRMTRRELVVVTGLLVVLAAGTIGPRIVHGSFSNDDWSYLTTAQHPGDKSPVAAFDFLWFRPLMMLFWPLTFGVLGGDASAHLALLAAVCILESLLVYAVVRQLGAERLFATCVAGLVLILPLSDSTRFWVCMDANVLSVCLWLGGILVALEAYRRRGRPALLLHGLTGLLYLMSIALYEITAAAVLVSGLLFIAREGRRALLPWALQAGAAGLLLALVTSHTFYEPLRGHALVEHAGTVAGEAPKALADAVWAPGEPGTPAAVLVCLTIVLVLAAGAALVWRGRLAGRSADAVRRWLGLAACGAAAAASGWAMIVPSSFLSPMLPGQFNRGNVVAGPGVVLVLTATAVIGGTIVAGRHPSVARLAPASAVAVLAVIGMGYVVEFQDDRRAWNRASAEQRRIVDTIVEQLGRVAPGSTVLSAGAPIATAPGVPVFAAPWDLSGALTLRSNEPALTAFPIVGDDARLVCARDRLVLHNYNDTFGPQEGRYGGTYIVNVAQAKVVRVDDRAACRRALAAGIAVPS